MAHGELLVGSQHATIPHVDGVYLTLETKRSHVALISVVDSFGERTEWYNGTIRRSKFRKGNCLSVRVNVSENSEERTIFLTQLRGYLDDLAESGAAAPLGFSEDVHFDSRKGALVSPDDESLVGITCANLVLMTFRDLGRPLVDIDDWPGPSPDDQRAQADLTKWFYDVLTPERREFLWEQIGRAKRVSPTQVVAAAWQGDLPSKFADVHALEKCIVTLDECT